LSTTWLLALLVWVHMGYWLAPHPWSAFTSGLGLATVVWLWPLRGPLGALRWWLCIWGVAEGVQIFVCQGVAAFEPIDAPPGGGVCDALSGMPLTKLGLWAAAALAVYGWRSLSRR